MPELVGIRELRHHAADIISAAESGQAFRVTVRGKDTGVLIAKQPPATLPPEPRQGLTLDQIRHAGLHTPTSDRFQSAMLEIVERGRDAAGRVGSHGQ